MLYNDLWMIDLEGLFSGDGIMTATAIPPFGEDDQGSFSGTVGSSGTLSLLLIAAMACLV